MERGDTDNTELLKKCGTGLPEKIVSKGNKLTVKFMTDYSVNAKGFRATWREVTGSVTLVNSGGSIKSPDFPNNYPNNKDQEWDLSAPGGSRILLTFNSFDLEDDASCSYDYVQISYGTFSRKYCGASKPDPVISTGNTMKGKFHSDYGVVKKGFTAVWETDITLNADSTIGSFGPRPGCPPGWSYFEKTRKCYTHDLTMRSWDEALAFCKASVSDRSATLASVHDLATNIFLEDLTRPGLRWAWLGGFQDIHESWSWADGSTWGDYNNWADGQPDNGGGHEDHLGINWRRQGLAGPDPETGLWNDYNTAFTSARQGAICQCDSTSTEDTDLDLEPPAGQRCAGRNYDGRRCCTPEAPCDEGEGDCDGPGDGGSNDGHRGCKGDLVCGSNNCLQFGAYYHEKDDCCERPQSNTLAGGVGSGVVRQKQFGWGPWSFWTPCMRVHQQISGRCRKIRTRKCVGNECGSSLQHTEELQEQHCRETDC